MASDPPFPAEALGDATNARSAAEAVYELAGPKLRARLQNTTGGAAPQLIDVEWRVDYAVRSSSGDALAPIYYVKLFFAPAVADGTASHTIVKLTSEQIDDFLAMVQEACHAARSLGER
mmetsp:Transcript_25406/g.76308  ORF Transcript_25406/g.76308 Transcript_25406/m.76308 type:complete len:119 (-) Transcript_25406:42-398(-)